MHDREKITEQIYGMIDAGICVDLFMDILDLIREQNDQIETMSVIYNFIYGSQIKDVRKLVRCMDCKWGYQIPGSIYVACGRRFHGGERHVQNWFCGDGDEREEGGQANAPGDPQEE